MTEILINIPKRLPANFNYHRICSHYEVDILKKLSHVINTIS